MRHHDLRLEDLSLEFGPGERVNTVAGDRVALRAEQVLVVDGSRILAIDAAAMNESGHSFRRAANGVWLTNHVPPQWIRVLPED
jgi:hypothetical protein